MSNAVLSAVSLDDPSGIFSDSTRVRVTGLCIKSALAGNLTITGMANADGSAAAWLVTTGTSGFVAPPAGGLGNRLSFSYANGADAGKAVAIFTPL